MKILLILLLIILIALILIKVILYLTVLKYGKISYDGFSAAGFAYNSEKDIFYSTKNAWQKNFVYTHMYDVLAPIFRMIIDTESIRFFYNDKNWLITFWKGQYGIVTGAEIGIYCTEQKKVDKNTIYLPANNNEMLDMYLVLYKNGKVLTKVKSKHWWLAVFKLGMFSNPKDLSMDIYINFPNQEMLSSFLVALKKLGYRSKNFIVIDNTFYFNYTKPHTRKIWTRTWVTDSINQWLNHKNVKLYNDYLNDLIDNNKIDDSKTSTSKKLIMINKLLPDLLKNIKENQYSKEIIDKILSEEETNIIFLEHDIYSENRVNKS